MIQFHGYLGVSKLCAEKRPKIVPRIYQPKSPRKRHLKSELLTLLKLKCGIPQRQSSLFAVDGVEFQKTACK